MNIIRYLPETPTEGYVVFAETSTGRKDRCIFKEGKFIAGGDFPVPPYELKSVVRWFDLRKYNRYFASKNVLSYRVDFSEAENIPE